MMYSKLKKVYVFTPIISYIYRSKIIHLLIKNNIDKETPIMKELKEGPITVTELSEWFGLKPNSLKHSKAKAKKLEILSAFADYHMEGRTLVIDKVHEPVYSKAYDKVEQEFDGTWHKNGIDTCTRVGTTIYYKNKTMQAQIKKETACNYV